MTTNTKTHTQYYSKEGESLPGTTTALGILAKPALIHWSWQCGMRGEDYRKIKDGMADIGTLAHLFIMNHLRGEKTDTGDFSKNDIKLAKNCFASYLAWEKSHKLKPVLIEKPLISDIYGYGGTPDCLCYIEDRLELLDFKTGKAIYPEMMYQLAAYSQLVREQGYEIKKARILRIGRGDNEGFEERTANNLDREFELFRCCLAIHNLQKELKR